MNVRFARANFTSILIALIGILVCSISVSAQSSEGCVTDKCHATVGVGQFVHGPVGARICTICHSPVDGKDHEFQFSSDKEELCFGCHEDKRDMMLEDNQHTPVAEGDCVGCHDPHQSEFRYSLKADGADLCFVCHDKAMFDKAHVHGPVGVGDCNVCHDPHASAEVHQLLAPPSEICLGCHEEQSDIPGRRHQHPPVADACVTCHNPHSNDAAFLLAKDSPGLCYDCHEDIAGAMNLEHQHAPVAAGECEKCHDVHGSANPKLFPRPQMELCLSCHEEMSEYLAENDVKHGPIKDGDCSACHAPHGSSEFRILKKYFPEEFYMPFDAENYAICFDCHNRDIATDMETTTLTDFRDGTSNLHFLHVNKEVKGRSCKACHEAHASVQEKHVRESVPFGKMDWALPIEFTKLEDGGSCVVGCHAPKEYHR